MKKAFENLHGKATRFSLVNRAEKRLEGSRSSGGNGQSLRERALKEKIILARKTPDAKIAKATRISARMHALSKAKKS